MNIHHTLAALVALSALVSSTASAGTFDGAYDLNYHRMDLKVQCGYVSASGELTGTEVARVTVDLEDGELPETLLDPMIAARYYAIEAADLTARQEKAAKAATNAFFTGLEASIERVVASYPDALSIAAVNQSGSSAAAWQVKGQLTDEDFESSLSTVGTMARNGSFELMPFYLAVPVDELENLHSVGAGAQLGGSVTGQSGTLRVSFQALVTDPATGQLWGCGVNQNEGFSMAKRA